MAPFCIYYKASTHDQSLAIASDVIDCEYLASWQYFLYSQVEIKQIAIDKFSDNSNGLQMDVVSIPKSKIVYHEYSNAGNYEGFFLGNELYHFSVPPDNYERPWYLRKNSNISLQVSIANYENPPSKMKAYIIIGDENINSFLDPPYPTPRYEYSIDLLPAMKEVHTINLDRSGYYYVAVEMQTVSQLEFFAYVTFDFFYINSNDYNFTFHKMLGCVGESVNYPLDRKSLVLCSVAPLPPEDDQRSIHVIMQYNVHPTLFIAIPVLEVLVFMCVPGIYLPIIWCKKLCRKNSYEPIEPIYNSNYGSIPI